MIKIIIKAATIAEAFAMLNVCRAGAEKAAEAVEVPAELEARVAPGGNMGLQATPSPELEEEEILTLEEIDAIEELREGLNDGEPLRTPKPPAAELTAKQTKLLIDARAALDGAVPAGVGGLVVVLGDLGWPINRIASMLNVTWGEINQVKLGRVYPRVELAYNKIKPALAAIKYPEGKE